MMANGNGALQKTIIGVVVAALGAAGVGGVNYAEGRLNRMQAKIDKLIEDQHNLEIWQQTSQEMRMFWIKEIEQITHMHQGYGIHPRFGTKPHPPVMP